MNKERYIGELKQVFPVLPDKKVTTGDTWEHVFDYDETVPGGKVTVTIHYLYTLIEESERNGMDCLKINGDYSMKINGTGETQGMQFTFNMDGEGSDDIYFAYKKGMFLAVESSSQVKDAADFSEAGLVMPMEHNYTTVTRIK